MAEATVTERVERRLAAILAADVFGYSRLMGADEEGTLSRLKSHRRELVDPAIRRHRGRIVKTTGDGVLVEFASPVEAVRCAAEVQRGMVARNANTPAEKRITFRVGINLGDVIAEKGDLFGDGVNVAARVETLSEPGGIAISRTVHDQIRDRLPFAFADAGEHAVKNIARPVSVYALSAEAVGKLDADIASAAAPEPQRPRWFYPAVGAAAFAIAALAWFAYPRLTPQPLAKVTSIQGPTVAVLPFDNLTGDAAQNSFADGLSEELISDLSGFKELRVLARNTTFAYKGKSVDVAELGRKLNAQYIIEGSVRRLGDQIRVTAQLIESSGGNHVWSQNYERDVTASNLLAVQEDLAGKISASLGNWTGAIAAAELQRSHSKLVAELNAYECMAQGDEANVVASAAALRRARTCLESLVQREPTNAEAWAGLSKVLFSERSWGAGLDPPESDNLDKRAYLVDRVMMAASRAVELAPADPLARTALALAYYSSCQRDQLRVETERAIALNPNDATVFGTRGNHLGFTGLWEIGVPLAEKGIAMSAPSTPRWWWWVIFKNHWFHGRYEQALDSLQKSYVEQSWLSHLHMAYVLPSLGRIDEAKAHVATLLKMKPGFTIRDANAYYTMWCFEAAYREKMTANLRLAGLPE
jgi:class 3 adenylate cyclase/TolB-like protein